MTVFQAPARKVTPSGFSRIGRQGIYDRNGSLVANELLFRGIDHSRSALPESWDAVRNDATAAADIAAAGDAATSQVISATFGDFGLAELSGGRPLFLNVTRSFLIGDLPLPFGPEGVVLEILETITVDDELMAGLSALRERGFELAVDDYVGDEERARLLEIAQVVKIDVPLVGARLDDVVAKCRNLAPEARLVAERVETLDSLHRTSDAGFELFQGYFFQRPALLETSRLSPSQMVCLRLLRALNDPDSTTEDLENVVSADPGLSLRVLRTANSASSATKKHISSLRQAVVMLGPPALRAWVLLTLMGGLAAGRRDDLVLILARATCAEAVARLTGADPADAYTAGLLSGVAQVLRTDVGQVAHGAGMGADVISALVDGTGPIGAVVRTVESHELDQPDAAERCGITPFDLSRTYLEAWSSALQTVSTTVKD